MCKEYEHGMIFRLFVYSSISFTSILVFCVQVFRLLG